MNVCIRERGVCRLVIKEERRSWDGLSERVGNDRDAHDIKRNRFTIGDIGISFLEDRNCAGSNVEVDVSSLCPSGRLQRLLDVRLVGHRNRIADVT